MELRNKANFANMMVTVIDREPFDVGSIWFTEEMHFHLNGFVKKIVGFRELKTQIEIKIKPQHSKVIACAAISSKRIIDYFFKHSTINTEDYVSIFEQSSRIGVETRNA